MTQQQVRPSSTARERQIAVEQAQVDRVYERVEELRDSAEAAIAAGYLVADIGNFGALVERDALVHRASRRLQTLDSEREGLVFGRLDLLIGAPRWIGRMGVLDDAYDPLVVDWRAPVAAPFYQATPADPLGVRRRRVIRTQGPTVVEVEDDLLDGSLQPDDMEVVGEGALLAALGRATGPAMRDIVATIQAEQDRAVRAPATGVTVISGGPGTGKTAVATHRAAYLLYRDRRRFQGAGVLIVGPSPVFMTYIERVLPSLGESSATLRDLGSLLDGTTAVRRDEADVALVKGSLRMQTFLDRAAADLPPGAPDGLRLTYRGEVLQLTGRQLVSVHRAVSRRRAVVNRLRPYGRDRLLSALWARRPDDVAWENEEFSEEVADRDAFLDVLDRLWPVLTPAEVLGWCADPARAADYGRGVLADDELDLLVASWRQPGPSLQDVPLLDELRVRLGRPPTSRQRVGDEDDHDEIAGLEELSTVSERELAQRELLARPDDYDGFAHVIVDESQDVSPMQWQMVARRGPSASWTLVGDPAQSAWPDPVAAAAARDAALPARGRHEFALRTNYRNSREIFAAATRVLRVVDPSAEAPEAVRSTGVEPRHVRTEDGRLLAEAAGLTRDLLADVEGTVGVICPAALLTRVRATLADIDDERLQVIDALESKGMEYDGVLAVDPDGIVGGTEAGWRTLYVVLSRSTQRLTTVGSTQDWLVTGR